MFKKFAITMSRIFCWLYLIETYAFSTVTALQHRKHIGFVWVNLVDKVKIGKTLRFRHSTLMKLLDDSTIEAVA